MRVLLANLKHLYQRRGSVACLCGSGLPGRVVLWWRGPFCSDTGQGDCSAVSWCAASSGACWWRMQMETASKPFSFCLPGHREAVRRLVFLAGLGVSLAFLHLSRTARLALFPGPVEGPSCHGNCSCWCWARISARAWRPICSVQALFSAPSMVASVLGLMTLVVALCIMFDVFTTIQYPILHWPVAVMALALVVGLASWWWLGRPAWFRRSCDRPWMGFFDPWDRTPAQRYRDLYATRFTKNIPPAGPVLPTGDWQPPPVRPGQVRLGGLYTTCVLVGPQWKGILTIALAWWPSPGISRPWLPWSWVSFP